MDVRVIDTSNHQGAVDWGAVLRAGRQGGIVKASEGTGYVDPFFQASWTALAGAAVRGVYHFAQPGQSTGAAQAQKFLSVVGRPRPRDLLVLDLEVGSGDLSAWALDWLATVERLAGVTPWVYSYGPFLRAHLSNGGLGRYPLWLAAYSSTPPAAPPPWRAWGLWQHTDSASCPGVAGKVDESIGTLPDPVVPAAPQPAGPQPTQQEVSGVNITAGTIPVAGLDDQGRGWVSIPAPISRVVFLAAQGSAPGRDKGYWPPVAWDVNDSGAETVVTLSGQPHEATVVYYSVLDA